METAHCVCGQITESPGKICFCKLVLKIIKNTFILATRLAYDLNFLVISSVQNLQAGRIFKRVSNLLIGGLLKEN